jgi:hypothetical protein
MTTYAKTLTQTRNHDEEVHTPAAAISLTVSGGATPSDDSGDIDIRGATSIVLQLDHYQGALGVDSASVDLDYEIYTKSGSTYDTAAFASGDTNTPEIVSFSITPGAAYMKVHLHNEDGANATKVWPTVRVVF